MTKAVFNTKTLCPRGPAPWLAAVSACLFAVACINGCGCSCGDEDRFKKIDHRAARTYDADAAEDGIRTRSRMSAGEGASRYYGGGVDILKKKESREIVEKLKQDGRRALRNPDFIEAEKLLSEGRYEEALKSYSSAASAGSNSYIERRALACKVSIDRVRTRESEELKKATSLLIDGRGAEATSLLEGLEKQNENSRDNPCFRQSISALKIKAYGQSGDNRKLIEEYIRQDKLTEELSERLSRSWTVPIE